MGIIYKNGIAYGSQWGMDNIAPQYSELSTYSVNDYVLYERNLYRCTTAIPAAEAWDQTHWTREFLTDQITALLNG